MALGSAAKESLARDDCQPHEACRECVLCQRCSLCIAHCTCPPVEMRKQSKPNKEKGKK